MLPQFSDGEADHEQDGDDEPRGEDVADGEHGQQDKGHDDGQLHGQLRAVKPLEMADAAIVGKDILCHCEYEGVGQGDEQQCLVVALADDDFLHLRGEQHADEEHHERYANDVDERGAKKGCYPAWRVAVAVEGNVARQGDAHSGQHDKGEYLYGALDDVVLSEIVDAQSVCQQLVDGEGAEHDEYLDGEGPDDIAAHVCTEFSLDDLQHTDTLF